MRRVLLALLLSFAGLLPARAGELGAVGVGYRFGGVPDFMLSGVFEDHQPISLHSEVVDYLFSDTGDSWRVGLVLAQFAIPDGYWRVPETRVDQAVFAEFPVGMVGLTAGYGWQFELTDRLTVTPVVGAGLLYVYGDIYATELIPGCTGSVDSCGHWDSVTRHEVTLTSRWMPVVQVSASLQWEIVEGTLLGAEVGVVNLPFAGVTFQQALDF